MLFILIDIHRNILSAQCIFHYLTNKCNRQVEISLKSSKINFLLNSVDDDVTKQLSIDLPECFFILNSEIASIQNSLNFDVTKGNDSITFISPVSSNKLDENVFKLNLRLQISDVNAIKNCVSEELSTLKFKDFMKSKIDTFQKYNIFCTNCSNLLTPKEINFQLISEYNEETSELSESWFCHKHDENEFHESKKNIIFISDLYFYINVSVINNLLLSDSVKEYKCKTCSSLLSLKRTMNYPNYIGFFCDKIMFQKSESTSVDAKVYRNEVALFAFHNILKDTLGPNLFCKMYLQCRVNDVTECLLLWANSRKVAQFLFHEPNDEKIPSKHDFKLKEVFKVMYLISSSNTEIAKKWKHDFNVEFFQISDNMMNVLKDLLQESSKYSLDDDSVVSGFSFGYLPAYPCVV